jgi:hypothetical protein
MTKAHHFGILLLTASLLGLESCQRSPTDIGSKIFTHKVKNLDSYVVLRDSNELSALAQYDDAVILVTMVGCHYCELVESQIKPYIVKTSNLIYTVDTTIYKENYSSALNQTGTYANLYPRIEGTPTFLFYRGGKLKAMFAKQDGKDDFDTLMPNYVKDVPYYCLNDLIDSNYGYYYQDMDEETDVSGFGTTALNAAIAAGKSTIVFTWRRCSDCTSYHENVLDSFLIQYPTKPIYYYEVDGYYLTKRSADAAVATAGLKRWSDFSATYHLSDYPFTDKNGNIAGVVPTTVTFTGNDYSLSVFANDRDPTRDSATSKLYFATSFYPSVIALRSATSVDAGDTTSSTYQKALKEIQALALSTETKLAQDFLELSLS